MIKHFQRQRRLLRAASFVVLRPVGQGVRLFGVNTPSSSPPSPPASALEPGRVRLFRMLHLNTFSDEEIAAAHKAVREVHATYANSPTPADDNKANTQELEMYRLAKKLKLVVENSAEVPIHNNTTSPVKIAVTEAATPTTVSPILSNEVGSKEQQVQQSHPEVLNEEDFSKRLRSVGEELDIRVWPIAISFAATGLSIGVIIPILPILVKEIHLPSSIFGLAVSSFGLAKLIGNVPSASWVEQYGRKPVLVGGMLVCAAGLGSVGFSLIPELGAPWLIGCRFVTGLGVAAFTSGAFMYMSDISTALNRTRTMAPVMSAFQAGTAVGPAIGGVAVQQLGIMNSYITVGASIAFLAALNQMFLNESMPPKEAGTVTATLTQKASGDAKGGVFAAVSSPSTAVDSSKGEESSDAGSSFALAYTEWKELMKTKQIRDIVLLNGAYWVALAGTQLTLLPLFMVADPLALSPGKIGIIFSCISLVSVAAAQPAAYVADKYGKVPSIMAGTGLLALSFGAIPTTTTFEELLLAAVPLALGSTLLSSVPTAHMSDLTTPEQRAQALALLRTAGDVGLLAGAVTSGMLSEYIGMAYTMQGNASMLGATLVWYGIRQYITISPNDKVKRH